VLWRVFEVKYCQYIVFKIVTAKGILRVGSLLQSPCDMMNAVAQTKPTSEALRVEVKELRSTAARVIEQASRLVERCAELEDLNLAEDQSQPNHDASHTARRLGFANGAHGAYDDQCVRPNRS
jgi:hypothetical protein